MVQERKHENAHVSGRVNEAPNTENNQNLSEVLKFSYIQTFILYFATRQ